MQQLLKHPVWTNKYSRFAIICALLMLPLSIIHNLFQSLWPLWFSIGGLLGLTMLVLVLLLVRKATKEQLAIVEEFIRKNTVLYRHYHIFAVLENVQQLTGQIITKQQAIKIIQKIRNEHQLGPIEPCYLENRPQPMVKSFKHPTMENKPYRYPLLCLAARLAFPIIRDTLQPLVPTLIPIVTDIATILTIAIIVLIIIAYCTANGWSFRRPARRKVRPMHNPIKHDICEVCGEDEAHFQIRAYHHGTQKLTILDTCEYCTDEILAPPILHPQEKHNCILFQET